MLILPELCISFYFLLAYCTLVTYVYIKILFVYSEEKKSEL